MNKKFIKKQKKILNQEKKALEKELQSFAKKKKQNSNDYETIMPKFGTHKDDEALEFSLYDNLLSVEQNLEQRLRNINQALEKIKKGTYGKCENCKEPICEKRLEAIPEAELCLKCKQKS